jgi:hypothetical protein
VNQGKSKPLNAPPPATVSEQLSIRVHSCHSWLPIFRFSLQAIAPGLTPSHGANSQHPLPPVVRLPHACRAGQIKVNQAKSSHLKPLSIRHCSKLLSIRVHSCHSWLPAFLFSLLNRHTATGAKASPPGAAGIMARRLHRWLTGSSNEPPSPTRLASLMIIRCTRYEPSPRFRLR